MSYPVDDSFTDPIDGGTREKRSSALAWEHGKENADLIYSAEERTKTASSKDEDLMNKKRVVHWKTPTPVQGKVQTLCGRIWNNQDVIIPKRLEEVSCVPCHDRLKREMEQVLDSGLRIKHTIPATTMPG